MWCVCVSVCVFAALSVNFVQTICEQFAQLLQSNELYLAQNGQLAQLTSRAELQSIASGFCAD